jgi:hypothetical protein
MVINSTSAVLMSTQALSPLLTSFAVGGVGGGVAAGAFVAATAGAATTAAVGVSVAAGACASALPATIADVAKASASFQYRVIFMYVSFVLRWRRVVSALRQPCIYARLFAGGHATIARRLCLSYGRAKREGDNT